MAEDILPDPVSKHGHFEMDAKSPYKTVGIVHDARGATHTVTVDEPEPLGSDDAPSPGSHLFISLVSCQLTVLNSCLRKARVEDYRLKADASWEMTLGDVDEAMPAATAKRIKHIDIDISLEVPEEFEGRAQRCLDVYDSGCIVGQSLKAGIEYTPHTNLVTKE